MARDQEELKFSNFLPGILVVVFVQTFSHTVLCKCLPNSHKYGLWFGCCGSAKSLNFTEFLANKVFGLYASLNLSVIFGLTLFTVHSPIYLPGFRSLQRYSFQVFWVEVEALDYIWPLFYRKYIFVLFKM